MAGCSGPGTTPAPTVRRRGPRPPRNARPGHRPRPPSLRSDVRIARLCAQPSPQCDQTKLSNDLCGQYCSEWFAAETSVVFAGTNNGECYCDTEYTEGGDANGQCDVECPESDTGCDLPCAGDPSQMCGGAWFNMIIKVSCGGWPWAWPFVYGLAGLSAGYLLLGTAANMSAGNSGLPNAGFWRSLGGLVNDVSLPTPPPAAARPAYSAGAGREWPTRWATSRTPSATRPCRLPPPPPLIPTCRPSPPPPPLPPAAPPSRR